MAKVAKRPEVSDPSIYPWSKKLGDIGADAFRRLKALEQENSRSKKTLAKRDLEIEVMRQNRADKVMSVQTSLERAR